MGTAATDRPMRADARRNRERVLAAAEAVFAEMGLKAQVEEVARRAGVGVGTVCRHFPTKQALIEAVLEAMYESLLADAEARARSSPMPAPRSRRSSSRSPSSRRATARSPSRWRRRSTSRPSAQPTRDALRAAIGELVTHAQAAGAIRSDIGAADVSLLFSGVAHTTALAGDLQPVLRQRYLTIILDGLRPTAATRASRASRSTSPSSTGSRSAAPK